MKIKEIAGDYSIVRLAPTEPLPVWVTESRFFSLSKTEDELSVVCETTLVPDSLGLIEHGWKCLKVEGPLDFSLTGILSSIANPLAQAEVSLFAISTFDTDYIMVKAKSLKVAKETLQEAGFLVS